MPAAITCCRSKRISPVYCGKSSRNSPRKTRLFPPWAQRERETERQTATTSDKGHGRIERRTLTSTVALNQHVNWPGVAQVCRVIRERTVRGQKQTEMAYYITSACRQRATADRLLQLVRGHWGAIENGVHWLRDTAFDEDRCTIRSGHAPQNLAAFRNSALNWLRRTGTGNLTARLRTFTRNPHRLFAMFGYRN